MSQVITQPGAVHVWRRDEPALPLDRGMAIIRIGRSIQLCNVSPFAHEPCRSWTVAWPDAALAAALAESQAATSSHAIRTSMLAVRIARDTCAIVALDPASDEAAGIELLRLPHALLPYVYSLLWDAARHDAPLLRPLRYHFPHDAAARQAGGQVMLGAWLLAALPSAHVADAIYLPAGRWYDWWSGQALDGPLEQPVARLSGRIPLYVRAGAVVPRGPEVRLGDSQSLLLDLYPGNGALTLYEGSSYNFDPDHSQFSATTYRLRVDRQHLRLTIGERTGAYIPRRRRLRLCVHAAGDQASHLGASFDPTQRLLNFTLDDDGSARQFDFSLDEVRENVAFPR